MITTDIKGNHPTTNEQGQVAIKYYQSTRQLVEVQQVSYIFITKQNICMAWVNPEHVDAIMNIKKQCCGNSPPKPVYFFASQFDIDRWSGKI